MAVLFARAFNLFHGGGVQLVSGQPLDVSAVYLAIARGQEVF